jgi:hypothetical protein
MRTRLTTPLVLTLLMAAPAAAQTRLMGRVIDDTTERPLADAQVTLTTHDGRVLQRTETDEVGAFAFDVKERISAVRLQVRRLSYKTNITPALHFDDHAFFQLEVRLDADAILLAPLEVVAWSKVEPSPFLETFKERVQTGGGFYITRADVEARRPMYTTDLLRDVPGLTVTGSGSGLRPVVQVSGRATTAQLGGGGCPTQIWIDGFLLNRRTIGGRGATEDLRLDDAVSPVSIEGIEVYRGLSSVPAEFINEDAKCGVIAIWTRRGGRVGREPPM